MEQVFEILKYTLPAVIVFITSWFIIRAFIASQNEKIRADIEHEQKTRLLEIKTNNQKSLLPVRLQAYERMALFLERISPGSIVLRLNTPGASILSLQTTLIHNIREEFDHNVAQQIYISADTWELIKASRDEMIKLVNSAAMSLPVDAKAIELSKKIIEMSVDLSPIPTELATQALKKEVKELW
jgi:hypothetical protein